MKKVFSTILLSCFALLLSAEAYYLLPNSDGWNSEAVTNVYDNLTIEGEHKPNQLQWEDPYQPERKAYEWFKDHYNAGAQKVITYKDLKDGRLNADGNLFSTVKVLWIHVDRHMDRGALENLFPQEVRDAIANYVKAGGNVYLSTYAARLAHLIGRAPEPGEFKENNGFGDGSDEWKVLADFSDNHVNHTHAIYKYLIANNLYGQKSNGLYFFHMQKGSPRSDCNCLWNIPNNLDAMNAFQNDHTCKVLGSWGHTEQFECAGLVEFYPKGDWKGTIIANGLAACSWASTNTDVHCVQHLTRGVLDYLSTSISAEWKEALTNPTMRIGGGFDLHNSVILSSTLPAGCTLKFYSNNPEIANASAAGEVYCNYFGKVTFRAEIEGDGINAPKNIMWQANSPELTVDGSSPAKYGYILPYSLHTMSNYGNENGNRPDFVSADWFNVNYIIPDNGCFLNPRDYNATNLIPQEVEVLWIHNDHVGLTSDQYFTDLGRENFVAALREFVDRGGKVFLSKQATRLVGDLHLLGIYDNQIDYYYPSYPQAADMGYKDYTTEPKDKWKIRYKYTYDTGESIDYSDHSVYIGFTEYPMIQDNVRRTNNNYLLFHGLNTYNEFTSKESEYQCKLLGCWGHNEGPYEGGLFAEFLPRTAGQGTVIMMGAAAYHWTGKEIGNINENLTKLTKNILDYLATIKTDVYTRDVTNGNYGTICLPRASKTITGATMWRAVDKNAEGVVIEQVNQMEAGVPYFFQATADVLRVEMQGETKPAGKANGLVGYIDVEGKMLLVPRGDNFFVLSQNQLYFVDSDVYLPSNYAYVNINEMSPLAPVAGMPRRTMRLPQSENATTALDNMQTTSAPTKIIQNGQVYILRDGHIYTTLGTQVK